MGHLHQNLGVQQLFPTGVGGFSLPPTPEVAETPPPTLEPTSSSISPQPHPPLSPTHQPHGLTGSRLSSTTGDDSSWTDGRRNARATGIYHVNGRGSTPHQGETHSEGWGGDTSKTTPLMGRPPPNPLPDPHPLPLPGPYGHSSYKPNAEVVAPTTLVGNRHRGCHRGVGDTR